MKRKKSVHCSKLIISHTSNEKPDKLYLQRKTRSKKKINRKYVRGMYENLREHAKSADVNFILQHFDSIIRPRVRRT